jgi:hypothetical protein
VARHGTFIFLMVSHSRFAGHNSFWLPRAADESPQHIPDRLGFRPRVALKCGALLRYMILRRES